MKDQDAELEEWLNRVEPVGDTVPVLICLGLLLFCLGVFLFCLFGPCFYSPF